MDEPTSALTETEVAALFSIIRGFKARGLAVIYISHRLEEIFAICDRVIVLRDGQLAGELPIKQATPDRVVRLMVGRPLGDLFRPEEAERRLQSLAERSPAPSSRYAVSVVPALCAIPRQLCSKISRSRFGRVKLSVSQA
jgi:ABC-type sugar transport system ATPase subunit